MTPRDRVLAYLAATERRDAAAMRAHVAAVSRFVFPGGRVFASVEEIVANSGRRYQRVAKRIERVDVQEDGALAVVHVSGTLHGVLAGGAAFSGVRFIDRFELADGLIRDQQVWNDMGEHLRALDAARQEAEG